MSRQPEALPIVTAHSTPAQPQALWSSSDFTLGAGAVIIQPSTGKACIIEDFPTAAGRYFLPRGRKDVGESLEAAALREVYEESGYRASFLPALHPQRQPRSPEQRQRASQSLSSRLTTEAFYIMTFPYYDLRRAPTDPKPKTGGEYVTFWWLCQIDEDAQPETGTQMHDEQGYRTHLLPFAEALEKMRSGGDSFQYRILKRGLEIWADTKKRLEAEAND